MDKTYLKKELWAPRSLAETITVYEDWAARYDAEVGGGGYETPRRIAAILAPFVAEDPRPVLDFGCGTGLSGLALAAEGIGPLHGTDITKAMVEIAREKRVYERLWVGAPEEPPAKAGAYRAIVAAGVISLGAAPPETIGLLLPALAAGDYLCLSFNDPTLAYGAYDAALEAHVLAGDFALVARAHGPHLASASMGSDVILLRRL